MPDVFLLVGLPYAAMAVLVIGTALRLTTRRFGVSSLSSQVLEHRLLPLGSLPWHIGIGVVLLGHLAPFLAPGLWQALTANQSFVAAVEVVGLAAAVLCALGLGVLIVRRLTSAPLQAVTTPVDVAVLALLFAQVALGIIVAVAHGSGAAWAAGTVMPYVWSLLTLSPDPALVADMPAAVKGHVVLAWIIFGLVPFSRLVHAFVLPLPYLVRAPQRVLWATVRMAERLAALPGGDPEEGRRHLLKAVAGLAGATILMGTGVLDKLLRFLRGDDMDAGAKEALATHRLTRLEQTAGQRRLELERLREELIPVARVSELSARNGKYFIDYGMRPALAFKGEDGLPILISAKCTHLGCTVGSAMDEQGRILCPCHISYFDVKTGKPHEGAPAKDPLAHLGWVLRDGAGKVIASRAPGGALQGQVDPKLVDQYEVCIARREVEG